MHVHTQNDTRRYPRSIQHSEFKKDLSKPAHATKIWSCATFFARSRTPFSAQYSWCSLNEHPLLILFCKLYDLLIHTLTNSVPVCLTNYNILMGIFSTLFNDSLETGSTEILVSKRCGIINCPGWNLPSMIFTVLVITQGIVYIHNTAVAELNCRCSPSSPHFMVSHRAFRKESLDHLLHDVAGITGYPVAEVTLTPDSPVWHRTIFSLKTFHSLYNFCLCNKA